ncbi:hypothetical protein T492DRAFT_1073920 [Pavlovales sp. CCMP2436]|nr:hypothetical protein T492DRAFT_1073920 [Pavlovales sp. CCMP2436]|mmetsp:Transcript_21386/g.53215  ORF Transcript_21386/g.53215 Transcript_21386/m.53215 type:complete len:236 (-) Transcript_21386:159-866(-)
MEQVYLARCRLRICACHLPRELCECTCALCKARRWERVTHRRIQPHQPESPAPHPAFVVTSPSSPFLTVPFRMWRSAPASPSAAPSLSNRELAERALNSSTRNSSRDRSPRRGDDDTDRSLRIGRDAFFDALHSPPPQFSIDSLWLDAPPSSTFDSIESLAHSHGLGGREPSPSQPVQAPAKARVELAWPSPARQSRAEELHINKMQAQAEAQLAVRAALDFMLRAEAVHSPGVR